MMECIGTVVCPLLLPLFLLLSTSAISLSGTLTTVHAFARTWRRAWQRTALGVDVNGVEMLFASGVP